MFQISVKNTIQTKQNKRKIVFYDFGSTKISIGSFFITLSKIQNRYY